jgi:hypothetical protein
VAEPRQKQPLLVRPSGRLLLGLVAFCAFLLDGTANSWSASHLRTDLAASRAMAAWFGQSSSLADAYALHGMDRPAIVDAAPSLVGR